MRLNWADLRKMKADKFFKEMQRVHGNDSTPEQHEAYQIGFMAGLRAASGFLEMFNKTSSHHVRLSDIILMKFNATTRKHARKNVKAEAQ